LLCSLSNLAESKTEGKLTDFRRQLSPLACCVVAFLLL